MKVLLMVAVLFACSVFTAHGKLPHTFAPGLEGSTVGNVTHGCSSGWGTSRASMDRCCRLRACCYARLAARRCRPGPVRPFAAPPAAVPSCSESPPPFRLPLSAPRPLSSALPGQRCGTGPPGRSQLRSPLVPAGSGTWCQRGACRCERAALLCRMRSRGQLRGRSKCRGRGGRC
ncbi:uncharacterized protein LOC136022767 isoform X3 [Lathamus discolor]|uniref:uncharacterized protein LOC136022767 isoform X3 n=1 Tax=Lathamus discolor TaxID=678569 RepID=UPI0032B75D25